MTLEFAVGALIASHVFAIAANVYSRRLAISSARSLERAEQLSLRAQETCDRTATSHSWVDQFERVSTRLRIA